MKTHKTNPMLPRAFRVNRYHRETYDTFTIELQPVRGNGGYSFTPGQFNMLYMYGTGEVPISISGDPTSPTKLIHTIRAVGSVTNSLDKLRKDDVVGVRGPFGTQWPVDEAEGKDVVIVAGGIGLAPLRPSIYYFLKHRSRFQKVMLLYGARTREDILYWDQLEQWRSRFDLEVHVTVDRGTGDWRGNVGVVTTLIPRVTFDCSNTVALVCGPEIMMRFTVLELSKCDLPDESIYLSMERNMKCGIGHCGHCQYGSTFICKDGPVFRYDHIKELLRVQEI